MILFFDTETTGFVHAHMTPGLFRAAQTRRYLKYKL